jgi:hypothetical protein
MESKEEVVERERLKHYRDYQNVIMTAYIDGFKKSFREAKEAKGEDADLSVEMLAFITKLAEKYFLKVLQREREQKKEI